MGCVRIWVAGWETRSVEMVRFEIVQQEVQRGSTWTTEIALESEDYQQKHFRGQIYRKSYDNHYSLKATADQVASRSRHYQAYNSARQLSTTVIAVQHFDTATTFEGNQLDRFHKQNAGLVCWCQYVSTGKRHRLRALQLKHQHVARLGHNLRTRHEAQQVSLLTKPGSWLSKGQLVANQLHEPLRITNLRTSEPRPSDLETPDNPSLRMHAHISSLDSLAYVLRRRISPFSSLRSSSSALFR